MRLLALDIQEIPARVVPETHHEHHHHGQGQVGEGLVEDEHEDRLAGQPGLVEGGDERYHIAEKVLNKSSSVNYFERENFPFFRQNVNRKV